MKATARPSPSAITQAFVPKPPRERPSASRMSRSACVPFSTSSRGLLMRTDAGAIQERHLELHPGLLRKPQQALPDTQARPADEGLSRPRPGTEVRRDGAPFFSILRRPASLLLIREGQNARTRNRFKAEQAVVHRRSQNVHVGPKILPCR